MSIIKGKSCKGTNLQNNKLDGIVGVEKDCKSM